VVGLYLQPPERALVLCVDEKPQIQAMERTAPVLPMGPGQVERHTHDYRRHGTLDLFAALDVKAGTVIGGLPTASPQPGVPCLLGYDRRPRAIGLGSTSDPRQRRYA
jgi:hypothetical protein